MIHSFPVPSSQAVLLCLLDLFPVLEKGLHWKGDVARPTTHCDEVLQLILTHMEPEHRILLRRTYARNLPAFVKRLGILTVRHMKRLERVIIGYLEVYDGPEEEARLKILETLKLLMQYTWPRIPCRLVVFLKALLKLICDVARDPTLTPEPVKNALLQEATDCLITLDHCSQGQVKVRQRLQLGFGWAPSGNSCDVLWFIVHEPDQVRK